MARWCGISLQFLVLAAAPNRGDQALRVLRPVPLLAMLHTEERIDTISTYGYRIQDHRTVQMTSLAAAETGADLHATRSLEKMCPGFRRG